MSTMNLRPCEEPMPVDGPVRVLYCNGKWQDEKGNPTPIAQRPPDWRERTRPREITTDWFPTRLEPVSCPGIGTFKQPSEAGRRKRATAYRQRAKRASA